MTNDPTDNEAIESTRRELEISKLLQLSAEDRIAKLSRNSFVIIALLMGITSGLIGALSGLLGQANRINYSEAYEKLSFLVIYEGTEIREKSILAAESIAEFQRIIDTAGAMDEKSVILLSTERQKLASFIENINTSSDALISAAKAPPPSTESSLPSLVPPAYAQASIDSQPTAPTTSFLDHVTLKKAIVATMVLALMLVLGTMLRVYATTQDAKKLGHSIEVIKYVLAFSAGTLTGWFGGAQL